MILKVLMGVVTLALLFSGVFTVEPNEVAVVLRFGKPAGVGPMAVLKPGLHWAFPYPVDEIVRIPAGQSHTVSSSVGWYATTPELEVQGVMPDPRGVLIPGVDGYLLSGDGNIFHARATLKYRISDPVRYSFAFHDTPRFLQSMLNNALVRAAAAVMADSAIYRDKLAFRDLVLLELESELQVHDPGIRLDPFDVQVVAPADVRNAFESVLVAEQERSRRINDSLGYSNEVVLKASGMAEALVQEGRSASNQVLLTVSSEAGYFNEQLPHYRRSPELFRRRLLAETMEKVVSKAQDAFILPSSGAENPDQLRIQLNREPARTRPVQSVNPP